MAAAGAFEGEVVLSASSTEGAVQAWDLETCTLLASYKGNASPRGCLCRMGPSHFLAAQTSKGALTAWTWGREQPALRCFVAEPLAALAASPDGALAAGGTASGTLLLWQTATGKLLRTWPAHHKAVAALAFAPDGSWLVSGGDDTTVCVWSLAELAHGLLDGAAAAAVQPAATYTWTAHTLPVSGVAVGAGAGTPVVASASLDRTAKVWSLCGGQLLRTLLFPSALTSLALDAADWTLFAGATNGRIYAAPLCGEAAPAEGGGHGAYELAGHTRPVRALAACADGRRLVSGSDDGTIKVWGLASRQALRTVVHAKGAPVTGLLLAPKSALAPLRAATAVIAARARVLPLAPFTKYLSDAQPAGAKPWEGPPVLLMGGAAGPADEQLWGIPALGAPGGGGGTEAAPAAEASSAEVAALRSQLEAARADAERWRALHGELRALVADQL